MHNYNTIIIQDYGTEAEEQLQPTDEVLGEEVTSL